MNCANNQRWRNFLQTYKDLPELWDTNSECYKNKSVRCRAYERLLKEYQHIDDSATVETLKRRLNNMRTVYRRELKKIVRSERTGATGDDVYVPCLWYFDLLDFLRDQEIPSREHRERNPIMADEEEEESDLSILQPKAKYKREPIVYSPREEYQNNEIEHMEETKNEVVKDDVAIYAEGWARMFRKMSAEQQLYAKQAIDEILLRGQLNKLKLNYLQSRHDDSYYGEGSP